MAKTLASSPKHVTDLLRDRRSAAVSSQGFLQRRPKRARRMTSALPVLVRSCRSRRITQATSGYRNMMSAGSIWQSRPSAGSSRAQASVRPLPAAAGSLRDSPVPSNDRCSASFFGGVRQARLLGTPPIVAQSLCGEALDRAANFFNPLGAAPSNSATSVTCRRRRRHLRSRQAPLLAHEVSCAFFVRCTPVATSRE